MSRFDDLSQGRRLLLLASLVLIMCLLLFALAEGITRVRQWVKYGDNFWGIEQTYRVDRQTGLRLPIAGIEVGGIRINSLGFRSPEIAVAKAPGTLRLAFLGASTTYCAEVSDNSLTWPHLLWDLLRESYPQRHFDFVNAAVPGLSVADSFKNYTARVRELDPDIVVIYHASNDISGNSRVAAARQGIYRPSIKREEMSWLARNSLLWYLVEKNLLVLQRQAQAADSARKLRVDLPSLRLPFEQSLERLVSAIQADGKVPVLVTFSQQLRREQSTDRQIEAAATLLFYMPYMTPKSLLSSFESYNDAIRAVAQRRQAVLIDDPDAIPGDARHFKDSVHFTDDGSRVMAQRMFDGLLRSPTFLALVEP